MENVSTLDIPTEWLPFGNRSTLSRLSAQFGLMDLIELTDGTIVGFWAIAAQCTNGWPTNDGECDTNDVHAGYRKTHDHCWGSGLHSSNSASNNRVSRLRDDASTLRLERRAPIRERRRPGHLVDAPPRP